MRLRARYLDPRLGRFMSMDSVQPNAPGTQGYDPYAYAANNPTTWVDPSGQFSGNEAMTAYVMAYPEIMLSLVMGCLLATEAPMVTPGGQVVGGLTFAACMAGVTIGATIPVLVCALTPGCLEQAWEQRNEILRRGVTTAQGAIEWTWEKVRDAADNFPNVWQSKADGGRYGGDPRTAEEIIAQEKQGSIYREFPSEWLGKTYDEIKRAADAGNARAKKAKKLLDRKDYDK